MNLLRAGSDRFRPRALSLIELVTTVGVLAILFAMLAPSLGEARREGKVVHCFGNLAGLAQANAVYASTDRAESAIPIHSTFGELPLALPAYAWGGKSGKGDPIVGGVLDSRYGTKNGLGPATRPLNKVIYGDTLPDYQDHRGPGSVNWLSDAELDLDVYRCPADYGYTGIHYKGYKFGQLTSFDHFGTSYAANIFWIGTGQGSVVRSNSPLLHRLGAIVVPARTLLFEENCGRFAWTRVPDPCPWADGLPGEVRGWHGRMWNFNVAFVDGHAGTIVMDGYEPHDIGRYPGDCDFRCSQCVLIRGDRWQKDTLPLPDVPTGYASPGLGRPSHEGGEIG